MLWKMAGRDLSNDDGRFLQALMDESQYSSIETTGAPSRGG